MTLKRDQVNYVSAEMFGYSEEEALWIDGVVEEAHIVTPSVYPNGKDYSVTLAVKKDEVESIERLHGEKVDAHLKALQKANPAKNYRRSASTPFSTLKSADGTKILLRAHTKDKFNGYEVTVPVFDEAMKLGVDIKDTFDGKEIKPGTKVSIKILLRPYPLYPNGAFEKMDIDYENGFFERFVEVGVTVTLLSVTLLDEPAA